MAQHHRRCREGYCVAWCALAEETRAEEARAHIEAETVAKIVADLRAQSKFIWEEPPSSVLNELADRYERGEWDTTRTKKGGG